MDNSLHVGEIFELGPDGYGYVLDKTAPGYSYAFCVDDMSGLAVAANTFKDLEGRTVSFRLTGDGRMREINLVS